MLVEICWEMNQNKVEIVVENFRHYKFWDKILILGPAYGDTNVTLQKRYI